MKTETLSITKEKQITIVLTICKVIAIVFIIGIAILSII